MMLEAKQPSIAIMDMGCMVHLFVLALYMVAGMDDNQLVNVSNSNMI